MINLMMIVAGIALLYMYHQSEVEKGNPGVPGMQQIIQFSERISNSQTTSTKKDSGKKNAQSQEKVVDQKIEQKSATNSTDAPKPPTGIEAFSEEKDMKSEREKAPGTMMGLPLQAMSPVDKNQYATYRPMVMKVKEEEKTVQSISDTEENEGGDGKKKDGKKDKKTTGKKQDKEKKKKTKKSGTDKAE